MVSRCRPLLAAVALVALFAVTPEVLASPAGNDLVIVEKGKAQAVIVHGPDSKGSAGLLRGYIQASTKAKLPIVAEKDATKGARIHVGLTELVKKAGLPPADMDRDGFVVRRDGANLLLVGKDATSTEFAVIEFMERFLGYRHFFPGSLGTCLDRMDTLAVPSIDLRREPHFKSRLMSGLYGASSYLRFNRFRSRYAFHHNLLRIVRPSKYVKTNPEFFPILGGKRYLPEEDDDNSWQPCLTEPGVIRVSIETARQAFDNNPNLMGFSVGINDSNMFCECDRCMAVRMKFDKEDSSNIAGYFYTYMNKVAEEVARTHPGKMIGCLAYFNCRFPPPFKLNDNICVYQCNDRSQYSSPDFRHRDIEIMRDWGRVCKNPCIYEWLFGGYFVVPRIYTHRLHLALNAIHRNGGDGYYSEAYPNWGLDGPKLWIVSRLLWDLDEDPEALRREFCQRLYGAAADTMDAYYTELERLWAPPHDAQWSEGIYSFRGPEQLDCYPIEAVERLEAFLKRAAAEADSDLARARVAFVAKTFKLSAMFVRQREFYRKYAASPPKPGTEVMEMLRSVARIKAMDKEISEYIRTVVVPDQWTFFRSKSEFEDIKNNILYAVGVDYEQLLSVRAVNWIVAREAEAFQKAGGKGDLEKRLSDAIEAERKRNKLSFGGNALAAVPRAPKPPKIDGRIDPGEWKAATRLTGLTLLGGKEPAKEQTTLLLMWDDENIYAASDCVEADAPDVRAVHKLRDSFVFRDDSVELFFVPPAERVIARGDKPNWFYQIIISPIGAVYDAYAAKTRWNARIKPKAGVKKGSWQVEVAIPWQDFGGKPKAWEVWRSNFCRGNRTPGGETQELSSWVPSRHAFNDPTYFGLLIFRP